MKRSRPPREVKFGYNPDIRSLNYRLVNTQISEFGPSDSKGLAGARARGFSEHPRRPRTAPASVPPEVYLQCQNRCHGPDLRRLIQPLVGMSLALALFDPKADRTDPAWGRRQTRCGSDILMRCCMRV